MTPVFSRRALLCGLALAAAIPGPVYAAPRPDPWPHWSASDEASLAGIDHTAWDGFLARYLVQGIDGINRLAYGRVVPADREALGIYIDTLGGLPITAYRRVEQLAYWINLYNALTVRTVLDRYPVASILDIGISPGLFSRGPWGKKLLRVEGEEISLDDIEHRILRPLWRDPRLHYALNCASTGCPNLQSRAFTAATAEATLDQGTRAYVNHPRGVLVEGGRLFVSSLYVWYKADFGGTDVGVIAHVRRYAAPPLAASLADLAVIAGDRYDWSLNDAAGY